MQGKITTFTTVLLIRVDQDNDGAALNEDHVDGKDDDADGLTDEDWLGRQLRTRNQVHPRPDRDERRHRRRFKRIHGDHHPSLLLGTHSLPVGPLHRL